MQSNSHIFHYNLSITEECELCPAFEVYLAGCNLNCQFCFTRSDWGELICEDTVIEELGRFEQEGKIKSLFFVGGEPSLNLDFISRFVKKSKTRVPVWLVSNFIISKKTLAQIVASNFGIIGTIYFGNDECAIRISGARNYLAKIRAGLESIFELSGRIFLRHLALPGHLECCSIPALNMLRSNFPGIKLSLMVNYFPPKFAPEQGELYRYLSAFEKEKLLALGRERGVPIMPSVNSIADFTEKDAEFIIEPDGRLVAKYTSPELVLTLNQLRRGNGKRRRDNQGA